MYPLNNGTVFKIGTTSTYVCKKSTQIVADKSHENSCIICIENDRDALYMPCKHNTACLKCSKNLKDCPICRTKILDIIRIYKNWLCYFKYNYKWELSVLNKKPTKSLFHKANRNH